MRRIAVTLFTAVLCTPLFAQPSPRGRVMRSTSADGAEMAIKQAVEQLGGVKKVMERDIEVLRHLRGADEALANAMQPNNAIQKAYEEVAAAKLLGPDFYVAQGVIRAERELESARRSPMSADLGRLRSVLRGEAVGPASRVVVRNATRLHEENVAWLRVQLLIADHLRQVSEITSASLRAAEQP